MGKEQSSLSLLVTFFYFQVWVKEYPLYITHLGLFRYLCMDQVEDASNSNQLDGALPNYLYYDNVRNFLVAVEDMGLPAFEAPALEQV